MPEEVEITTNEARQATTRPRTMIWVLLGSLFLCAMAGLGLAMGWISLPVAKDRGVKFGRKPRLLDRSLDVQLEKLKGCDKIFKEKRSGVDTGRPALERSAWSSSETEIR